MDVSELAGAFVVEIGIRQAWPFLGLCDNRTTPARETRVYIDAKWSLAGVALNANQDTEWLSAAAELNNQTVTSVSVERDGSLHIKTALGDHLWVSGQVESYTVGEAWWLAPL